jgi:hypothetical protein
MNTVSNLQIGCSYSLKILVLLPLIGGAVRVRKSTKQPRNTEQIHDKVYCSPWSDSSASRQKG